LFGYQALRTGKLIYWLLLSVSIALTALFYLLVIYVSGWRSLLGNSFVVPIEESIWWDTFSQQIARAWDVWAQGINGVLVYALILGFVLSLLFHRKISRVSVPMQVAFFVWLAFLVFGIGVRAGLTGCGLSCCRSCSCGRWQPGRN
jgi:hypothetical protein